MTSQERTACILGANGFIGRNSVAVLLASGFRVRAAVRRREISEEAAWLQDGVEVVEADVTELSSLKCVKGCDLVVNCAGIYRWWVPDSEDFLRVNDLGAGHAAQACLDANVRRLVHFSTPMAYGYPEDRPFTEASKSGPHASEYARTKRLGDLRIKELCHDKPLEVVTLFLGCTIGEGDATSAGRIAAVIRDHILGKIPMLVGPETNFIYVHINDVRQALERVVTASAEKVAGQDFFIGNSDDMMTTRQFFELVGKHTGRPAPTLSLNVTLGYWIAQALTWVSTNITGFEPPAPVDVMRTAKFGSIEYTCAKSVSVLGMEYSPVELAIIESVRDVKQRMADGRCSSPLSDRGFFCRRRKDSRA